MTLDAMHLNTVFLVGSFWFWLVLVGTFSLMIFLTECERGFWAFVVMLLTLAGLQAFTDANLLRLVWDHPIYLVVGVAAYFILGTVWSVVKWWLWCNDQRHKYDELKLEFLHRHGVKGVTVVPENLRELWRKELDSRANRYYEQKNLVKKPEVLENKSRILNWMTYWPCSLVFTALNDPIRKLFRHIYYWLRSVYQSIADRAWHGVDNDFAPVKVVDAPPTAK